MQIVSVSHSRALIGHYLQPIYPWISFTYEQWMHAKIFKVFCFWIDFALEEFFESFKSV